MDCKKVKKMFSEFIDDEISGELKIDIENHLKSCDACCADYEALLHTWNLLTVSKEIEPSAQFSSRLWEKIQEKSQKREYRFPLFSSRWAQGAVPVLVLMFIVTWYSAGRFSNQKVPDEFLFFQEDMAMIEEVELIENITLMSQLDWLVEFDSIQSGVF